MTGWTLRSKQTPALRVDLRGATPLALASLTSAAVERFPVAYGNSLVALAEFFYVEPGADATLRFAADLARFDRVGWQMEGGRLIVEGNVGDYAGACMRGGEMTVQGSARDLAACEMAGGTLRIAGDAADFAASTLPGSMDGMRGGSLIVQGKAGARFGDRMRRGTAVVFGDTGDFLASRMVAGTIAIGGSCGVNCGLGMRRGSVVFAGTAPQVPLTFVQGIAQTPVFWQLLARDLARHGGVFADLPSRRMKRWLGDLSAGAGAGKGELILVH
ncbi:MAG: formylmethanofuran dehydrogenase subunit C [Burkholderiaceae bacterium]